MPNQFNTQASSILATSATTTLDDATLELVKVITQAADERKGDDIVLLNVAGVSTLADYFVIVTGFSKVQVRAIASAIEDKVEAEMQRRLIRREGVSDGTWVLMDYGDVVVHIQMPHEREFYNLEAFWGHADRISVASLLG